MRYAVLLFLIFPLSLPAQDYNWKQGLFCFLQGTEYGLWNGYHETLSYHYLNFQSVHPNANPQFWNPNYSWKNKWKNGDKEQGPKFLFSNNLLAWTTDAIHPIKNARAFAGFRVGALIVIGEKKPWWHYATNATLGLLGSQAGFSLIYRGVYR